MNNKEKVIDALDTLRIRDISSGDKFSALAYTKAIRELKKLNSISSLKDVEGVAGVGKKIKEKIKEVLETGGLKAAEKAKEELSIDVYQDLLKIQGVGPVKAKELINKHSIKSITELRSKPELLNDVQILGLKYYEDSLERIPRNEMEEHEKIILESINKPFDACIVGSYRRGVENSGDIDVLIKAPENMKKKDIKEAFENLVKAYQDKNYLIDILALGEKKCMGYVKLNKKSKARRIDLLITPEKEYPYALLYFTGSDSFNVAFRKYVQSKGYTINEHGLKYKSIQGNSSRISEHTMKSKSEDVREVPEIKTEKEIFDFFGLEYKEPKERKDESSIEKKKKLTLKNVSDKLKKK
jgi:DNA polymerase lambda